MPVGILIVFCDISFICTRTANIHDSKMAPVLLQDIQDQNVLFSVADAAYDSQHIYEIARACNIFALNSINPRNGEQNKSTHRRVLSQFI
ncbi:hypothetical protein ABB04_13470 [Bacillus tropicus]|nr:hypothetical protein [Bacillus tropicus]